MEFYENIFNLYKLFQNPKKQEIPKRPHKLHKNISEI